MIPCWTLKHIRAYAVVSHLTRHPSIEDRETEYTHREWYGMRRLLMAILVHKMARKSELGRLGVCPLQSLHKDQHKHRHMHAVMHERPLATNLQLIISFPDFRNA